MTMTRMIAAVVAMLLAATSASAAERYPDRTVRLL
jgi:hypothetical protein